MQLVMVEGHFLVKKFLVHKYQLCQASPVINTIKMQNELNEHQTCVFHFLDSFSNYFFLLIFSQNKQAF